MTAKATHADMANAIRFLSMDAIEKAKSGHPGMPMGMADVATVLFTRFMKFDAKAPKWADRDRFVLSAGHGSMLLYALGYLTGFEDLDIEQIRNFRQMGYRTAGHPEFGHVAIADTTTGPLGQGITNAVGFALAEKMLAARHGKDIIDHYTYVIAGDGCLMEGISQEAISMAGHWGLEKLIVLWDDNSICIDGDTSLSTSDDQLARFQASNWDVSRCDGHDPEAIAKAIEAARASGRPSLIACKTVIGYGAPTKAGTEKVHGAPLGAEELAGARDKLNWPHAPFEIPAPVLEAWRAAGSRGGAEHAAWAGRLAAYPGKAEFERANGGTLPQGWREAVHAFKKKASAEQPKWATRKASQEALEALTPAIPEMIGGSADLTHSNLTHTKVTKSITPSDFSGRYIHYGVREHGMAAVMNGLALHGGFIPYGGTFLIFANYLWPALRMSAMMEQRVIYVLTHDSIGLGEDGPTHQPIETIAALRATPNVLVFRPCDPVETMEAYEAALDNITGPSVLALSRQNLPTLRVDHTNENMSARGAYVLAEAEGKRLVTILATGSEVSLALDARKLLAEKGIGAAVVSMPCWELFERQPKEYRATVLGEGTVRVAVEALGTFGWERWVGEAGAIVGMKGFGASAPAEKLYEHFGITAKAVADAAQARL
ncbi:transketolase [Paramagnetospirillum marisnigri]|uniref:Transketolase n=1 Tax=Paramagnetospirillum marisnigri TaxID=1285242 RepID=A0A178MU55_9PROT|nr:transketolase [Paramagnetospirillum marisnigri]OAN53734.1 transketolase [Paramagnetospirillum marisnigri]